MTGLPAEQLEAYRERGHVTVAGVFTSTEIDRAITDIEVWSTETLARMRPEDRQWYIEETKDGPVLRKLDNPHSERPLFLELARKPALIALVETIIGPGVSLYFSQVFMKPARGGGPKPAHQDNYYFGPADPDGLVTAWLALDEATVENGCMRFADGSHKRDILQHGAPPGQPFNLQVPEAVLDGVDMSPAPVPRGGVSFHHGGVLHNSGDTKSNHPRRACAFHYITNSNHFANPTLAYDERLMTPIS